MDVVPSGVLKIALFDPKAETGKLLWKVHIETHDSTRLTGAPVAYNGTVYVPVASWEEVRSLQQCPC